MYLTYAEYTGMGGTITEAAYARFEFKARKNIDYYTFNRLANLTEQSESVKMCMYELIGIVQQTSSITSAVSSEHIGDYSVSYASNSADIVQSELSGVIESYLAGKKTADGVPLLYMGVSYEN